MVYHLSLKVFLSGLTGWNSVYSRDWVSRHRHPPTRPIVDGRPYIQRPLEFLLLTPDPYGVNSYQINL